MARIRTIKPEYWKDELIGKLSLSARLLFIGTWNLADDEGRLRWSPPLLKAEIFPYDNVTTAEVALLMDELVTQGRITPYTIDHQTYALVTNWYHQKIDRPSKSRLPAPPDDALARRAFVESSASIPVGNREQGRDLVPIERFDEPSTNSTMIGNKLLEEHLKEIGPTPRDVKQRWGQVIDTLIADGISEERVRIGLKRIREDPRDHSPGYLQYVIPNKEPQSLRRKIYERTAVEALAEADEAHHG